MNEAIAWLPPPTDLVLRADEIHLWRASLAVDRARRAALCDTLAPDELARGAGLGDVRHAARYCVARGILRGLLARYLGLPANAVALSYTAHGRPQLAEAAPMLSFTLAHSGDRAVYAFAAGAIRIGVDVERLREDEANPAVARRFFSADETADWAGLTPRAWTAAFYRTWTRREAIGKAEGCGWIGQGPLLGGRQPQAGHGWSEWSFAPWPDYTATLVTDAPTRHLLAFDVLAVAI